MAVQDRQKWAEDLIRPFSKEDLQTVYRHMKRCSISLIIRLIKTTIGYHVPTVRMAIIKKPVSNKRWRRCGEQETLVRCWWECHLVQPPGRMVWRFLKKLKTELSAIPLLGIYPEKMKTLIQKDSYTPVFIAALFTIVKTWKQPKCPLKDEWTKKMWYIFIQWTISCKKEWKVVACNNLDRPRDDHTKWNKKKTNAIWYHYMWNLKNDTNELLYKTEMDSQT